MTKFTDIGVEKIGHVTTIEIQRPPLNFFDISLINQIADALTDIDNDPEARAVRARRARQGVLRRRQFQRSGAAGAGGARKTDPAVEPRRSTISMSRRCASSATRSRSSPPSMAPPSAAAWGLRSSADFRVTCPEARFAANFTKLGFHPGFGLTVTLPELVGKNNAELIFYTSRRVTGEEATRMGLANDLRAAGSGPRRGHEARAGNRRMLAARPDLDPRHHARRPRRPRAWPPPTTNSSNRTRLRATEDFKEGVKATAERRAANFKGR